MGKQKGGGQAKGWKSESSLLEVILHADEGREAGGSPLSAGGA